MVKRKLPRGEENKSRPSREWIQHRNNSQDDDPLFEASRSSHCLEYQPVLYKSSKESLDISQQDVGRSRQIGDAENVKITKLLEALDEFLQLGTADNSEYVLKQCKSLQASLEEHRGRGIRPDCSNPPSTVKKSTAVLLYEYPPQAPASLSVTPWTFSSIPTVLPHLPAIYSPALETAVFTHLGVASRSSMSYERLEWVGDAYIELISTLLISSTFTTHVTGRLCQIRETCVKNATLATYARSYGFAERARLPSSYSQTYDARHKENNGPSTKVMGDIFEAYVAAVILSDPEDGLTRATNWLRALWAQTIASDIKTQVDENQAGKSGEPIIGQTYRNSKETLAVKLGSKGVKLNYRDAAPEYKDPNTKLAVFTVGVYLDGWGEKNLHLGTGSGVSKKDAGMKAAETALANTRLLSRYVEMKRVYDEDRRKEKEEAALQNDSEGVDRHAEQGKRQEAENEKNLGAIKPP